MEAVVLKAWGEPLVYSDVPEPVCGSGEVLVEVVAAPVLSYTNEVFSGQRHYLLDLPAIPGCGAVGKVLETGPDATQLKKGMWVFCDPTVRSRDSALMPDIVLQGWSARGGVEAVWHCSNIIVTDPLPKKSAFPPRMPYRWARWP